MKFIAMVWPAFFARVKPVSAMAKPACMNMTRKPQTRVQTMLMATRFLPTASPTFAASGSAASIALISSAVGAPAEAPTMSAMPPVLLPEGSGEGSSAAGAGKTRARDKTSTAITRIPYLKTMGLHIRLSFLRLAHDGCF